MVVRKVIAGAIGGAVGLVCSAGVAAPAGTPSPAVSIVDSSFSPGALTVQAGETVVWTNDGTAAHTVTADDSSFDSGSIAPGQSFSHTFSTAGSSPYYCTFHGQPGGAGMAGQITVQAAVATTTTAGSVTTIPSSSPGPTTGAAGETPTTAAAELARTGTSTGAMTLAALALVAAGVLALRNERRRT